MAAGLELVTLAEGVDDFQVRLVAYDELEG